MLNRFMLILVIGLSVPSKAISSTNEVAIDPKGEFAQIDVKLQNETVQKLLALDKSTIELVRTSPEKFNPPVLYAMSSALFSLGDKPEASFWFYTGQLKARSDANKALDVSARQAVSILSSKFGSPINKYTFQNIDGLKETVSKVIEADSNWKRDYDPRWISLHGLDVFTATEIRFANEAEWDEINNQTRKKYLRDFTETMELFK